MSKNNIVISCDLDWVVTGFATLGGIANGYDTTDYPDNFIDSFDIGKFKFLKDEGKVVEVEGFTPDSSLPEPSQADVMQEIIASQGTAIAEQQQTIQMQSMMMDALMEQIATLGLVVVPTAKKGV